MLFCKSKVYIKKKKERKNVKRIVKDYIYINNLKYKNGSKTFIYSTIHKPKLCRG